MAVFRCQIFYSGPDNAKWSNVWHIQGADVLEASVAAYTVMKDYLLTLLHTSCQLTKLLTSDEATSDFIDTPINEAGTSTDTGDLLPFFNSAKVFIPPAGFGRPDIKFFKGLLTETLVDGRSLTTTLISAMDDALTNMINDMIDNSTPLVADDGAQYSNVTVQSDVQMRQMHRKRRRTPAP